MTTLMVAVLFALVSVVAWRRLLRLPAMHQRVLLTLQGEDMTLEGVLLHRRGRWLVLADCQWHRHGAAPVRIDGETIIATDRVLFIQAATPRRRGPSGPTRGSTDDATPLKELRT